MQDLNTCKETTENPEEQKVLTETNQDIPGTSNRHNIPGPVGLLSNNTNTLNCPDVQAYDKDFDSDQEADIDYLFPEHKKERIDSAKLKKQEEAMQNFLNTIDINPKCAYLARGHAYAETENYNEAIEDFREAIVIDPEFAEAYSAITNTLEKRKKQDEAAIERFTEAIKTDPEFRDSYLGRGKLYMKLGNQEDAIKDFTKAINIDPKCKSAYFAKEHAYAEIENFKKAIEDKSEQAFLAIENAYGEIDNQEDVTKDYN